MASETKQEDVDADCPVPYIWRFPFEGYQIRGCSVHDEHEIIMDLTMISRTHQPRI